MNDLVVKPITFEATLPLRMAVLRRDLPREASIFPGDNNPGTQHLGAFIQAKLMGIASLYRADLPSSLSIENGENEQTWQLRGMAVDESVRGYGCGQAVLKACIDHVARQGGTLIWCNARVPLFIENSVSKPGARHLKSQPPGRIS